jgi:hypothetical protein
MKFEIEHIGYGFPETLPIPTQGEQYIVIKASGMKPEHEALVAPLFKKLSSALADDRVTVGEILNLFVNPTGSNPEQDMMMAPLLAQIDRALADGKISVSEGLSILFMLISVGKIF